MSYALDGPSGRLPKYHLCLDSTLVLAFQEMPMASDCTLKSMCCQA